MGYVRIQSIAGELSYIYGGLNDGSQCRDYLGQRAHVVCTMSHPWALDILIPKGCFLRDGSFGSFLGELIVAVSGEDKLELLHQDFELSLYWH